MLPSASLPRTLETPRLTMAVLDGTHLEEVHGLFSAPGHTVGDGPVTDRGETVRWLERRAALYAAEGLAWYGLWTRDGTFVGTCGLLRGDRCGTDPEIGYEVAGTMRGLRYGAEAAAAVTRAAHRAGVAAVWATVRPANRPSVRIVESLGYELVRCEDDAKGPLAYYRHLALQALAREPFRPRL